MVVIKKKNKIHMKGRFQWNKSIDTLGKFVITCIILNICQRCQTWYVVGCSSIQTDRHFLKLLRIFRRKGTKTWIMGNKIKKRTIVGRKIVLNLYEQGKIYSEIEKIISRSRFTVKRVIKRFLCKIVLTNVTRCGRP